MFAHPSMISTLSIQGVSPRQKFKKKKKEKEKKEPARINYFLGANSRDPKRLLRDMWLCLLFLVRSPFCAKLQEGLIVDTSFGTPMDNFNTHIIDSPILPYLDNFE